MIRATLTSHRCDVRCEYAIGSECNCSCNGRNHGKGWTDILTSSVTAEQLDGLTDEEGNDLGQAHRTLKAIALRTMPNPRAPRRTDVTNLGNYQLSLI